MTAIPNPSTDEDSPDSGNATLPSNQNSPLPTIAVERPSSSSSSSGRDTTAKKQRLVVKFADQVAKGKQFMIDYKKSTYEVYKDFLDFVISHSRSLDMLCRPWAPDEAELPSWIPKVNRNPFGLDAKGVYHRVNADPLVGMSGLESKAYRAAKTTLARYRFGGEPHKNLFVEGFILDRVEEKKAQAMGGVIPVEWLEMVGWNDNSHYPPDHFWRTLVGNRDNNGKTPSPYWPRACRDAFKQRAKGGNLITRESTMYHCPAVIREYLERVQRMVWERRLVRLSQLPPSSSFALAPAKTKKRDLVCILYGCSVPVVLREIKQDRPGSGQAAYHSRPIASNDDRARTGHSLQTRNGIHYEFIGECYVHGMMDGEAFRYKHVMGIKTTMFELR